MSDGNAPVFDWTLDPSPAPPRRQRRGKRPCRVCGKPDVRLWRDLGVDLCQQCFTATTNRNTDQ
jgi:ribosomal protein S14